MEHRAFPILLAFYQEYSGRYKHESAAPQKLCRDLGVRIIAVDSLDPLAGSLHSSEDQRWDKDCCISAATKAESEHRAFVIYHELAHWRLRTRDEFFAGPRKSLSGIATTEVEVKEEYWCNAFATAMIFAWADREVMWENHEGFLAAGTEETRGTPEFRKHSRDIYCGQRIHLLNKKHFSPPYIGFTELANDLIIGEAKLLGNRERIHV